MPLTLEPKISVVHWQYTSFSYSGDGGVPQLLTGRVCDFWVYTFVLTEEQLVTVCDKFLKDI